MTNIRENTMGNNELAKDENMRQDELFFFKSMGLSVLLCVMFFTMMVTSINATELNSVDFSALPGNKTKIELSFSEEVSEPNSFSIDEPARVVLDFPQVTNNLSKKTEQVNIGSTQSISTVEAGERTRMVVNLSEKVPYTIDTVGRVVTLIIDGRSTKVAKQFDSSNTLKDIDFRRGLDGEGLLTITLNNENAEINVRQERDNLILDLSNVSLPDQLHRRLDVIDFATPVQTIETERSSDGVSFIIQSMGKVEHLAYQSENKVVIEVRENESDAVQAGSRDEFGYTGEKLSLNFQNIEVRAVLQLLADFTQLNLVTSDTVQGNVTLRLKNVPWDQALDIILKTKGLGMRQNGNVMLIAPAIEIAAREKQELAALKQLEELEPLYSEVLEINFAKASDLSAILSSEGEGNGSQDESFMSSRGSVTVDDRTNSLLIRDTAENLRQISSLVEKLDIPIRQVLIESRIVIASNDFTKSLGVRFGTTAQSNTAGAGVAGSLDSLTINSAADSVTPAVVSSSNLNVDLPVANPAGSIALALAKLPLGAILGLELSAMQAEGKGEVISSPKVITSNQSPAIIEQGTEIPYQEAASSGATSTSFKKAVLSLEVTPQITPDDQIIMDLKVNKDQPVFDARFSVPSIDTKKIETQVLVDNGETVVLGGVYEQTKSDTVSRVPFFGDLPYVGFLFKTTEKQDDKTELLVFVTPKIIKDGLNL
jgi:type IV pilus assembly protein PilQ